MGFRITRDSACARLLLMGLLSLLLLPGCEPGGKNPPASIMVLRIGLTPDQNVEEIAKSFTPLLDYLAQELEIPCVSVIPTSYEDLIARFDSGEIDLAFMGGYVFVQAHERSGAMPLVLRKCDLQFTSQFIVRRDHEAKAIQDLAGTTLAFGSEWSTSGHVMPRYELMQRGIDPEQFFAEYYYTGAHDATAYAVRDGKADVGAMKSFILVQMFRDGRLSPQDIRILDETGPYTNYVWAVRPGLPETLRIRITDAFLALSQDDPNHAVVLSSLGAQYYLPAHQTDYDELVMVAGQIRVGEGADDD